MRTGAIFFCAVLFLVAGCAQVPRPATFPYSFQEQLQSASHWQLIAKSTIQDLCTTLVGAPGKPPSPIYVQSSDKSPFGRAFQAYLITELIKSGFSISSSPDNSISVNWSVQLIRRNAERRKPDLPGLPAGVLGAAVTVLSGPGWNTTGRKVPHTELILTTTVTRTQGILAANSKTYYINDQDRYKYWESGIDINLPAIFTSDVNKPVTFTVVNR
jgi:hypothetical protein